MFVPFHDFIITCCKIRSSNSDLFCGLGFKFQSGQNFPQSLCGPSLITSASSNAQIDVRINSTVLNHININFNTVIF